VISFDPAKRQWTLEFLDLRRDDGEKRIVCLGLLQGRIVVIVYTKRSFYRHIISMRKANAREQRRFRDYVS
jgi:uncharacterized DUF497 family protein